MTIGGCDALVHAHILAACRSASDPEARGATISDSQIHSVRLPGYVISAEVIFGMPDQRLTIRHDAGSSARPYVDGALLAIRKVSGLLGVHRGLDAVLDLESTSSPDARR